MILTPRKSLNKAFLKLKPNRTEIDAFKANLITLLDRINPNETEEFHKNLIADFLKKTYYDPHYFINTNGRNDLVIHTDKMPESPIAVIIEAKKMSNTNEMMTKDNLNKKALHELVLYYLRERITNKNLEIKQLIATNINEWFIFDANVFEKCFAQNKAFVKQFTDFENKRLSGTSTDFFYNDIAKPYINTLENIEFTHFDIQAYQQPLRNENPDDDNLLIALFKVFSPEHLLKLPFANDSNSLDKRFYGELLHIIGLAEIRDGGKKLIQRCPQHEQLPASLLESTISQLKSLEKISRVSNAHQFGTTEQERLFNVSLELSITWINRILFLKLLEAQLISYHKGDKNYQFLNIQQIKDYDELNSLFFQVLAKKHEERENDVKTAFEKVPYLNSSLFEPTNLEHETLFISNLRDKKLPIFSTTVLKDEHGKKLTGELPTLEYLFAFLNAYDFSSEGSENIQEDNKTLINASVLGLIFEKINGYKDGSFFTPGFITMYMCHETIRKAVIQKFNEVNNWNCQSIEDLFNKIEDKKEANSLMNQIRICDPAVGSGHFLVSALNELIAIKQELGILLDKNGKRLRDYSIEVVNDELVITDEDGKLFEYHKNNKESQRIQETLFHEKQTIIENCLFGVDINPNSVKICRLRLWIELLKNAYYKTDSELETLPNIDINIKTGNSLISRFDIDTNLGHIFKKKKGVKTLSIEDYKNAVHTYQNAESKAQKRAMEQLILDIKNNFRTEIAKNDPKLTRIYAIKGEITKLSTQTSLFEISAKEKKEQAQQLKKLTSDLDVLETQIEEIKSNKIYENAFEWRFEFPEVLDDEGNFIGFDVIIGNPPYIQLQTLDDANIFNYCKTNYKTAEYKIDTYPLFYELAINLLSNKGLLSYITPNTFLKNKHSKELRYLILSNCIIEIIVFHTQVFNDASVDTLILSLQKSKEILKNGFLYYPYRNNTLDLRNLNRIVHIQNNFLKNDFELDLDIDKNLIKILSKIESNTQPLKTFGRSYFGIQTFDRQQFVSESKINSDYYPVIDGNNIKRYICLPSKEFVEFKKTSIKSGGDIEVYKKNRIVVRQIGIYPEGSIIEPYLMTLNTIYNIYTHDDNLNLLKFLLSLINSRLFQFYWYKKNYDNKATFPKIKKEPIENLPIKKITPSAQVPFIELVEKVLKGKEEGKDTSDLEKEIDKMVYDLYELTAEEIAIIEKP